MDLALFAPRASEDFGKRIAARLGVELGAPEERDFEDGEHKTRPVASVRGKDVYLVSSLHEGARESVNDKLCRLLFLAGATGDAGAGRVTCVVPYLCYARKDRRTQPRDPVTTRYVAAMFEAVGVHRVVVLDVHNLSAFQNAFRIPTEHLESKHLFARHFAARFAGAPLAVVSPDAGGMKRARELREAIARTTGATVATGMTEKYRDASGISGELFAGDVAGRTVIIPDDLVASGSTLIRTARACREHGAQRVYAAATHAPFTAEASGNLGDPALDGLIITNTIPPSRLEPEVAARKLEVLDATPLFAEAIRRLNVGGSIADLLENPPE